MKSPQATILGKDVYIIDSHIKTTPDELACEIRKYEANSLLRVIADLGNQTYKSNNGITQYHDVPVNDSFLIFSALFILKCSSVKQGIDANEVDLQSLFWKLWFLYDYGTTQEKQEPEEIMLRIAYKQFPYQVNLLSGYARAIYFYKNVWPKFKEKVKCDIFVETLGLTFDQLLLHVFLYLNSDKSFFCKLKSDDQEKINETYAVEISSESEEAFLQWASKDRTAIITYVGSLNNVLEKFPIINIGTVAHGPSEDTFLILNKNCLYLKVSQYLYYDFIEKFNGGRGDNMFKEIYGDAFEDYVGQVIHKHFKSWHVYGKVLYNKNGKKVESVDWIVWHKKKLILIEVKQSSIFLPTKKTGSIDSYKEDCNRTISKAFGQLQTTKKDIKSGKFSELIFAKDVEDMEMVCVIADPLYFGNMLLPKLGEEHPAMHVVNIGDFEDMLDIQKNDQRLHYLLEKKRKKKTLQVMDFKEYNISISKCQAPKSMFLHDVFVKYFSDLRKSNCA